MRMLLSLSCALTLVGCDVLPDDSPSAAPDEPPPGSYFVKPPEPAWGVGLEGAGGAFDNGATNEAVTASVPPVPIQGGTLLVMKDGHTAVVADPDRDRVMIADLRNGQILATLALRPGDEPGRLIQDDDHRVHVVLRRAGAIATIDVAARKLVDRREVCAAPRGIAYVKLTHLLLVACDEGDLIALPAAGGAGSSVAHLDGDLRDVIVVGERILVSRFKSAELIELDHRFRFVRRTRPAEIEGPPRRGAAQPPSSRHNLFSADVAYRTIADASGRVLMLHQRAQSSEVLLPGDADTSADVEAAGSDSGSQPGDDGEAVPYGGFDCTAIVRPALSVEGPDGMVSGPMLPEATLAVDVAISRDGKWVAMAVAGSPGGERGALSFGRPSRPLSVITVPIESVMDVATPEGEMASCAEPRGSLSAGQVVAVAFDAEDRLIVQTREPSGLQIITHYKSCQGCGGDLAIDFGGESRADTGHAIFHSDAGAGVACASCHPGGTEDGHTWLFSGLGARRTQLFDMGIEHTLPLHWDGELATFNALVTEVFVRRMGGPGLTRPQVSAMQSWIGTLEPGVPLRPATDPAVERGKALFESDAVACASCHTGPMLTDNKTVDVGTGGAFQVPSLIGVAHHAPWIHTGCARTLRERFDPACGGDQHGHTADLNDGQLDDLVAYLESL
jgi:hypothetical protein